MIKFVPHKVVTYVHKHAIHLEHHGFVAYAVSEVFHLEHFLYFVSIWLTFTGIAVAIVMAKEAVD